jgi:hypothetical protein
MYSPQEIRRRKAKAKRAELKAHKNANKKRSSQTAGRGTRARS